MGRKSKNHASNAEANNGTTEQDDFGDQPTSTPTTAPTTTVAPSEPGKLPPNLYFQIFGIPFPHDL